MFELFGKQFFQALHKEAEPIFGEDHPCVLAALRAAETGEKSDIETAQQQLAALPSDASGSLMASVHKAMRENPEALLNMWNGPVNPDRRN